MDEQAPFRCEARFKEAPIALPYDVVKSTDTSAKLGGEVGNEGHFEVTDWPQVEGLSIISG